MIQRVILFTEYWFVPGENGTDHLEGNQFVVDKILGKGVAYFHNKKGGVLRMMFIGEMSMTQKVSAIWNIELECGLKYIDQKEVQYLPEFEQNLKSMFGEKLVIK